MRCLLAATLGVLVVMAPLGARADDEADAVHVDVAKTADDGLTLVLERIIDGTDLWESVCVGTCDSKVSREGQYRVNGHGLRPSLPFALAPERQSARVHLDAKVSYKAGWVGGILLTVLGPVVALGGGIAIATSNQSQPIPIEQPCSQNGCPPPSNSGTQVPTSNVPFAAAFTIGVGVAMTIAGIVAIITTDHTTVRQRGAMTFSPRSMSVTF
jgi:hypothetical protein